MNMANQADKEQAALLFNSLNDYIARSRDIIARGDYLELNGLDEQVHGMCDAIQHLSIEESREFRDKLDDMMLQLNLLQQELQASREELAQGLADVSKHRNATVAYKSSENAPKREGTLLPAEKKD